VQYDVIIIERVQPGRCSPTGYRRIQSGLCSSWKPGRTTPV
jgi:hypothetical protein